MATKRRKKWWQMLRGPRGHRGFPGPTGADYHHRIVALEEVIASHRARLNDLERKVFDLPAGVSKT